MEFEWDEAKNRANELKHGLRFEDALDVFDDPRRINEQARTVNGEARTQSIGNSGGVTIVLVVHTERAKAGDGSVVRLISARPASRKER